MGPAASMEEKEGGRRDVRVRKGGREGGREREEGWKEGGLQIFTLVFEGLQHGEGVTDGGEILLHVYEGSVINIWGTRSKHFRAFLRISTQGYSPGNGWT